jgi:hypothetical protein
MMNWIKKRLGIKPSETQDHDEPRVEPDEHVLRAIEVALEHDRARIAEMDAEIALRERGRT